MRAWNYVVTAHKPTAVSHSCVGNFTAPHQLNLIVAKCNRMEIYLLTPQGLQLMVDVALHGTIATLELFRSLSETQDFLFISMERYRCCVHWDGRNSGLITRSGGDVSDFIGRHTDNGQIGVIDPQNRLIGLHLYDGLFKVIPFDNKGNLKEALNIRLQELLVLDIKFLYGCARPTVVVLHQDNKDSRHVKTYEVALEDKDFVEGSWSQGNLDNSAHLLIPVPLGGVIIIGVHTIVYCSAATFKALSIKQVIPFDNKGNLKEALSIRLQGLLVLDIKFLHGCARSTVVVLHQKNKDFRHVKTYGVALEDKEFVEGSWSQNNLDNTAHLLTPVPLGGVIIIGEHTIVYCSATTFKALSTELSIIRAVGQVDPDGSRYLDGDTTGSLHLILITNECGRVTDLKTHYMGEMSIASTISYLDSGLIYICSRLGDSQLITLNIKADASASFVESLEQYMNTGQIVDQVITCSGAYEDGSIRAVRNGAVITDQASVELKGMKGLWSLKSSLNDPYDTFLVVTFINETSLSAMNGKNELEEVDINGFDSETQTLACGSAIHNQLIQVTSRSVRLVSSVSLEFLDQWCAPARFSVNVAAANANQVLFVTSVILGASEQYFVGEHSMIATLFRSWSMGQLLNKYFTNLLNKNLHAKYAIDDGEVEPSDRDAGLRRRNEHIGHGRRFGVSMPDVADRVFTENVEEIEWMEVDALQGPQGEWEPLTAGENYLEPCLLLDNPQRAEKKIFLPYNDYARNYRSAVDTCNIMRSWGPLVLVQRETQIFLYNLQTLQVRKVWESSLEMTAGAIDYGRIVLVGNNEKKTGDEGALSEMKLIIYERKIGDHEWSVMSFEYGEAVSSFLAVEDQLFWLSDTYELVITRRNEDGDLVVHTHDLGEDITVPTQCMCLLWCDGELILIEVNQYHLGTPVIVWKISFDADDDACFHRCSHIHGYNAFVVPGLSGFILPADEGEIGNKVYVGNTSTTDCYVYSLTEGAGLDLMPCSNINTHFNCGSRWVALRGVIMNNEAEDFDEVIPS